jgi:hypothetical protein
VLVLVRVLTMVVRVAGAGPASAHPNSFDGIHLLICAYTQILSVGVRHRKVWIRRAIGLGLGRV